MIGLVMLRLVAKRVREAEAVIEGSLKQPNSPLAPMDLEYVVEEILAYPALLEKLCQRASEVVLTTDPTDAEEIVRLRITLEDTCDRAARLAGRARLAIGEQAGRPIAGAERLVEAGEKVVRLKERILAEWPALTPQETAAELEAGGFQDCDEAFSGIVGVDIETWRRRVEEHKRKYPNGLGG